MSRSDLICAISDIKRGKSNNTKIYSNVSGFSCKFKVKLEPPIILYRFNKFRRVMNHNGNPNIKDVRTII